MLDIEEFKNQKLSDWLGEVVSIRLNPIEGFCISREEGGQGYLIMPYNIHAKNDAEVNAFLSEKHINKEGFIMYNGVRMQEITDEHIVIRHAKSAPLDFVEGKKKAYLDLKIKMDEVYYVWKNTYV